MGFRKSLFLLAAIAAAALLLATGGGLWQAHNAAGVAEHIYQARTAPTVELMRAVDALHRARQTVLIALSEEKEEAAQMHLKRMPELDRAMRSALQAYAAAAPDQSAGIACLEGLIAEYDKARDQSVAMIAVGDLPSALENIKSNAGPKFDKVLAALSEVIQAQGQLAGADYQEAAASLKSRGTLLVLLSLATLGGMAAMFVWIGRGIMRQLGGEPHVAAQALAEVAAGHLGVPIAGVPPGSLLADLRRMSEALSDMVREIQVLTDDIGLRSERTFTHMRDTASRGASQASAASSVAAGVEELASSIESVSEHATSTGEAANGSLALARAGAAAIGRLVVGMQALSEASEVSARTIRSLAESSNNIMGIVAQINEISEQTNLLALNAAIEAARAGEQGRGFAVVADEVRKLAEKTGAATHEIRDMLEGVRQTAAEAATQMQASHDHIQEGTQQADTVAAGIRSIETQLEAIAAASRDVSNVLREQRATSQNIASQMEHIADMAGENSTAATQVVGEAGYVSQAAEALRQRVARFKL